MSGRGILLAGADEATRPHHMATEHGPSTEELRKARAEEYAEGVRAATRMSQGQPSIGREPPMRIMQARTSGKLKVSLWVFSQNEFPTRDFWEGTRDHLRTLYEHDLDCVIGGTFVEATETTAGYADIVAKWGPEYI